MSDKNEEKQELKNQTKIKTYQILIPIIIGIGVVIWIFLNEFKNADFGKLPSFNFAMIWALFLGLVSVIGRDFFMTLRFRIVTNHDLSWKQALRVCLLCEFTSAITPSSVGGSAVGMIFMSNEGINIGRATTLMLITIFLDELFFVISCPLILTITQLEELFGSLNKNFTEGIRIAFWVIYSGIALWTVLLFMGIIWKPKFINRMIKVIFKLKILSKWRENATDFAKNMIAASEESKKMNVSWWIKSFLSTALSWISRYLLVCALFIPFVTFDNQWLIFARQCVIWLVLMVSPTPGGSGLSEWIFTQYYSDLVVAGAITLLVALAWRILSYYLYLLIGVVIIPSWFRNFKKKKTSDSLSK